MFGSHPFSKHTYIQLRECRSGWEHILYPEIRNVNENLSPCPWHVNFRLFRTEKEKLWCSASSPPLLNAPNSVAHWCIFFLQDSLQGKPDWADLMVTAKDFWADKQRPPWILLSDFLHNRLLCQPILDVLQSLFLQLFKQGIAGAGTVLMWQAWCVCELQINCLEKKLRTIFLPS